MGVVILSAKKLQKNLKGPTSAIRKQTAKFNIYKLLQHKGVHVASFAIIFFGILFLFASYKKNNTAYNQVINQHIRSDLSIPAEHVFLKRPNLAKKIKDYFSQSMINKPAITVLGLVGVGGAGKTTLARAYGKSLANASVVWEINAETRSSIIASFTKLAHAFAQTKESKDELTDITGIQNADEMTKKIIDFVATHLQISPNWLLIFDNVESFSDLDNFFPHDTNRYGSGNIIITTHNQSSGTCGYLNDNSNINIDTLNTGEMLTLFTKMTYNTEAYVFSREKEKKLIPFYGID